MVSLSGQWLSTILTAAVLQHQAIAIEFTKGTWLEELPGYRQLHRHTPRTYANLSLVGEDIQVSRQTQVCCYHS